MDLVTVKTKDKTSLFSKEVIREFEYDPSEFTCSPEAIDYVASFMAMGYSIEVEIHTPERINGEQVIDKIVRNVAGYNF